MTERTPVQLGPWSPEEDDRLREMATSKQMQLDDIANQLGRSRGAVRMRSARLKIPIAKSAKLMGCPAWLEVLEDRSDFVFLSERAAIVRKIFELSAAGLGGYTIAKQLNAERIPTFGPSPEWDQSTIHNMLRNRATIGEYQPKRYTAAHERLSGDRDRRGVTAGDVVRDYYPAVIDEDLFNRTQEARRLNLASRRGRKGRLITNLFAGISTCAYCGAPVKFYSNGKAKSLICYNVLHNQTCYRTAWSYQNFEQSFFELVKRAGQSAQGSGALQALPGYVEAAVNQKTFSARLILLTKLRAAVVDLKIASSGTAPIPGAANSRVRRDQLGRYFDVTFLDGLTYRGFASSI